MPLNKLYTYEPWKGIGFIQNPEKRIIGLLEDVRNNAALLIPELKDIRLNAILEVVEKGEWKIKVKEKQEMPQVELNYKIDLSKAKEMLDNYRNIYENQCRYCNNYTKFNNREKNLTGAYCKKGETDKNIDWFPISNNTSLRIRGNSKNHCKDRIPKIKSIEEILQEHTDH